MNWFRSTKPFHLFCYSLLSFILFIIVSWLVFTLKSNSLDLSISKELLVHRTNSTILFFKIVTTILSPAAIILYSLFLILFFLFHREWFLAHLLILSITGGFLSYVGIKYCFLRYRPIFLQEQIPGFSYPSGHATISALFLCFMIGAFVTRFKYNRTKVYFVSILLFLMILTGFSRVYLGNHFFMDIIGGYSLGVFILLFTAFNMRIVLTIRDKEIACDRSFWNS